MKTTIINLLIVLSTISIFSCSNSETGNSGTIKVSITDAPIDSENIESVFISIISIEANGPNGWETIESFETPEKLDILSYQNGTSYFLAESDITAGDYNEIRFILDIAERRSGPHSNSGSYIQYKDGSTIPLYAPSGEQTGYKAKGAFTITPGGVVAITLDLDLRKALVEAGNSGNYLLKPVVRMIINEDAGIISGNLDTEGADSLNNIVVFAYQNDTFTEEEIANPAEGEVRFPKAIISSSLDEAGNFSLAFISSGTYDLFFATFDEAGNFESLLGTYQDIDLPGGQEVSKLILLSELE